MAWLFQAYRKATVTEPLVTTKVHRRSRLNVQNVEPWSSWTTAAKDHIQCHSCQLRTGNCYYNSHSLTKFGQWRMMSLDFNDIRMVGSRWHKQHEQQTQTTSMDPYCLISTIQVGKAVRDIFLVQFGLLSTNYHCLKATVCLNIIADHVYVFMTTLYPSSNGCFQ